MKSVCDIPVFQDIPILVRAALNEPVDAQGKVTDEFRLTRAVATLKFLSERGARVIAISHIDPAGGGKATGAETLKPVAEALSKMMRGVSFCPSTVGKEARDAVRALPSGGILVLENLRRNKGETLNDLAFAQELAALGDVFVEDSFDTCHREHASIVGLPKLLPAYAGLLLEEEVAALTGALTPTAPSLAVIGGAKFSTKETLLDTLLGSYTSVFVGGALANDFLKASGQEVGQSLVSDIDAAHMKKLLANKKLVLPIDSIVVPKSALDLKDVRAHARVASFGGVQPDEMILDHGPGTSALLADLAKKSKTILWNGPLGMYEKGFVDATDFFARATADSGARSVVGGGDTIASIQNLGLLSQFSFVSTGGGAMLEFLAKGTLPGIAALG